jgi:hypothetical protein
MIHKGEQVQLVRMPGHGHGSRMREIGHARQSTLNRAL